MEERFKLCILFGDAEDRPPGEIAPGWERAEVPVALQVKPFESRAVWERQRAQIEAWNLPPIRVSSHFRQGFGLKATGPEADFEQAAFWSKRAFERLSELGVEVVGIYGDFFVVPEGYPRDAATDQGKRFAHLLAGHAERSGMLIALEPTANPRTLWPSYREGVEFAKAIGWPEIG